MESTSHEGIKLNLVLNTGPDLGHWVSGVTEDGSKLGLCVKGLVVAGAGSTPRILRKVRPGM